jgi:2-polyprenyl-6-methoxyphenol hydroxylase-like FAD-dependent oxidoreductase
VNIAVVGCGVAGQAVATLLADAGHAVTVFERFAEPRPVGAGLLLQPTGLAVLRALGLADQAMAAGVPIKGLEARTYRGRQILALAYGDLHPAAHGLGIQRSALFEMLHSRLLQSPARLVTGTEVANIDRAEIVDETGQRHGPFTLIVVADGAHSALRRRLMPRARAPLYPWGCLWINVPDVLGLTAEAVLRQRVRGTREMMGLLPVGRGLLTMYWSVPVDALDALDLASWRRAASALWPEASPLLDHVTKAGGFARATYRHVALPRWNEGPVVFIGDAAHGTSPQLGQGANLGLVDAYVLARSLMESADIPSGLALFVERRTSTVRFYRQASHLLTPFFQSRLWPLGLLRDVFMGPACRLPMMRPLMTSTLAGLRRGWLSSARLDDAGSYRLDP